MFKRLINIDLEEWKASSNRKPLVLRGARQVGKTVAARMFGSRYTHFTELNLELPENAELFKRGLSADKIIQTLKIKHGISTDTQSGEWLLFLDEIQACPEAVPMLRYFHEQTPTVHVLATGSLLETALMKKHISFPVGRVEYKYLYPMNFEEFIEALSTKEMLNAFHAVPTPEFIEEELFFLFHQYALIGGMPEAVAAYADTNEASSANAVYSNLFTAYQDDIPKYARNDSMKAILRHCLNSAPLFAASRIQFAGFGESNYGSREIGEALRTLEQVMMLNLLYPTTSVDLPLLPNMRKSPRLQFLDTGLVHYTAGIQDALIGINDLSDIFRGRIIEQLVGQELLARSRTERKPPLFWVREKTQSQAELDFMESSNALPVPIEVKSGREGKLRSLHGFMAQQSIAKTAIRLYRGSYSNQRVERLNNSFQLLNIPYYHCSKITEYLAKQ